MVLNSVLMHLFMGCERSKFSVPFVVLVRCCTSLEIACTMHYFTQFARVSASQGQYIVPEVTWFLFFRC